MEVGVGRMVDGAGWGLIACSIRTKVLSWVGGCLHPISVMGSDLLRGG